MQNCGSSVKPDTACTVLRSIQGFVSTTYLPTLTYTEGISASMHSEDGCIVYDAQHPPPTTPHTQPNPHHIRGRVDCCHVCWQHGAHPTLLLSPLCCPDPRGREDPFVSTVEPHTPDCSHHPTLRRDAQCNPTSARACLVKRTDTRDINTTTHILAELKQRKTSWSHAKNVPLGSTTPPHNPFPFPLTHPRDGLLPPPLACPSHPTTSGNQQNSFFSTTQLLRMKTPDATSTTSSSACPVVPPSPSLNEGSQAHNIHLSIHKKNSCDIHHTESSAVT